MKKRQFVLGAVAAALACMMFVLAGCSGANNYQPALKSAEVAPPVIGEEGTLRVGVNTENPPLAGMGSGKIIGIDVDIASAIADEMGLKISIVDVGSDPASAIADGKVDIVMGIDSSNSESDFWVSPSYLPTGIALFATSPDAGIPTADSGATFAAQTSSKSAWAVSNEFGEDALKSTDSLSDAFTALQNGEVQYVAADAIIGLYAAHGANDGQGMEVSIVAMLMKPSGYCMGVANENTELQTVAGDVLARLVENGTIDVIERKWLGTSLALDNLTVIGDAAASDGSSDGTGSDSTEGDGSDDTESGSADGTEGDTGDGSADASGDGTTDDGSGDAGDGSGDTGDTGDDTGVGTPVGMEGESGDGTGDGTE